MPVTDFSPVAARHCSGVRPFGPVVVVGLMLDRQFLDQNLVSSQLSLSCIHIGYGIVVDASAVGGSAVGVKLTNHEDGCSTLSHIYIGHVQTWLWELRCVLIDRLANQAVSRSLELAQRDVLVVYQPHMYIHMWDDMALGAMVLPDWVPWVVSLSVPNHGGTVAKMSRWKAVTHMNDYMGATVVRLDTHIYSCIHVLLM